MSTSPPTITDASASMADQQVTSSLWIEALDKARADNHALVEQFEELLCGGLQMSSASNRGQQLQKVIDDKLKEVKSRQWTVQLAGMNIKVREQLDRVIGVVTTVRDLGNSIAALDPLHAGLPWAGVCVMLSLLVGSSNARAAVAAGLEKLAILIPRYEQVEKLYLDNDDQGPAKDQLHAAVVSLYANVLAYQIEVIRYLGRNAIARFAKSALQLDDWREKLQLVENSDARCKASMTIYEAVFARAGVQSLHNRIAEMNDGLNQRIADITTSGSIVDWNPGPNTDPEYLSVLYSPFRGRAGFFRLSLNSVHNDQELFVSMRIIYAQRQHRLWRRDVQPSWLTLNWVIWYDVKRIEYVKFTTHTSSKASYTVPRTLPVAVQLPPDIRLGSFHDPMDTDSHECVDELREVLADGQRWGLLIVEEFEIIKFGLSLIVFVSIGLLMLLAADDFGLTAFGIFRLGFIGIVALVIFLGLLPHPALTDVSRKTLTTRKFAILGICIVLGHLSDTYGHSVSNILRTSFNVFVSFLVLVGMLFG